jgi:geranylgeranyl diphosphate synthase, type I
MNHGDGKSETGEAAGDSKAVLGYFATKRGPIAAALRSLATRRGAELAALPGGGPESLERIVEFCLRGKMIRGCLVFLGAELAHGACDAEALAGVAASMELLQAGLLAHDDIMDRDETRRGAPTIHARYAAEIAAGPAQRKPSAASDAPHIGESLGICLGDLCYFEAFGELALALSGNPRCREALALCSGLLSEVALAQMADVRWGASREEVPEAEILAMYRCKTARYTFSLPLALGAIAASGGVGSGELIPLLMELGESLGILFQIRDDELGLFGDESSTGKALGSDLREGKKTLFRSRLLAAAPRSELPRLERLFGGGASAGPEDLAYIRRLSEELGVADGLGLLSRRVEAKARELIGELPGARAEISGLLNGLVEYVTRRDK